MDVVAVLCFDCDGCDGEGGTPSKEAMVLQRVDLPHAIPPVTLQFMRAACQFMRACVVCLHISVFASTTVSWLLVVLCVATDWCDRSTKGGLAGKAERERDPMV